MTVLEAAIDAITNASKVLTSDMAFNILFIASGFYFREDSKKRKRQKCLFIDAGRTGETMPVLRSMNVCQGRLLTSARATTERSFISTHVQ
ncbi:hypothetical protein WAI453_011958 [Rhynchosporium graminicola]